MKPILFNLYSPKSLSQSLLAQNRYELGSMVLRAFPDGESYIKFDSDIKGREVVFLATLDQPNEKSLPLFFAAETARALGASKVSLIAPYLAYMRQDKQFHPGEGITSNYYAAMLSQHFDFLLTVDPHLHRHHNMNEIFTIPATVVHATAPIAAWIKANVKNPLIIGPDGESAQWVSEVAQDADAPFVVSQKVRSGDRDVKTTFPEMSQYQHCIPILVDDIISTGVTMQKAITHVKSLNMQAPVCIGIHAIFAGDAYTSLQKAGAAKIVSCNTIEHPSNAIDVALVIAEHLQ